MIIALLMCVMMRCLFFFSHLLCSDKCCYTDLCLRKACVGVLLCRFCSFLTYLCQIWNQLSPLLSSQLWITIRGTSVPWQSLLCFLPKNVPLKRFGEPFQGRFLSSVFFCALDAFLNPSLPSLQSKFTGLQRVLLSNSLSPHWCILYFFSVVADVVFWSLLAYLLLWMDDLYKWRWGSVVQMFCPDVGVIQCSKRRILSTRGRVFPPSTPSQRLTFLSPPSQCCFVSFCL